MNERIESFWWHVQRNEGGDKTPGLYGGPYDITRITRGIKRNKTPSVMTWQTTGNRLLLIKNIKHVKRSKDKNKDKTKRKPCPLLRITVN